MKLVYAEDAVADLKRLRGAAHSVATELISRVEELRQFPRMGVPVEMAPDPDTVRDMVFGRYVVRYAIHPSVLIILRIWHGLEGER